MGRRSEAGGAVDERASRRPPASHPFGAATIADLSIEELRELFVVNEQSASAAVLLALENDRRAGARAIRDTIEARRAANRAEGQRMRQKLRFETELWDQGLEFIAGVDEAGMSPLAGPVVAGAVILPRGARVRGVDDSKVLDAQTREELAVEIKARAVAWAVGLVDHETIDRINIYRAGLLAMKRAVEGLARVPQHLLIDARRLKEIPIPQTSIIKGDALSATIGAASIVAKTHRDALMREMDQKYPGYGFAQHKGYPTAEHQAALKKLGVCPIHRRSFAPVRDVLGGGPEQGSLF